MSEKEEPNKPQCSDNSISKLLESCTCRKSVPSPHYSKIKIVKLHKPIWFDINFSNDHLRMHINKTQIKNYNTPL